MADQTSTSNYVLAQLPEPPDHSGLADFGAHVHHRFRRP